MQELKRRKRVFLGSNKLVKIHNPFLLLLFSIILVAIYLQQQKTSAIHEHLCLEDDYTNELPIFIEKRTICNFESVPVPVYSIKTGSDINYEIKLCLKGEFAETFNITKENEIKLVGRLEQTETNLKLQIIKNADTKGTPTLTERRQAVNAIQFILAIEDCEQIGWQTIVVFVLTSICIALLTFLAIMMLLYKHKSCINSVANEEDRLDEESFRHPPGDMANDESFINPRRTSSYEFTLFSKQHETTPEHHKESEEQL